MDKHVIVELMKKGLITMNVDASKYESIDDLINKGVITIPGAKQTIMEIINKLDNVIEPIVVQPEVIDATITETIIEDNDNIITDSPEDVVPIEETPTSEEVIIDTPTEETPIDETPTSEEPTVIEEVVEEVKPKKTRTKKTE